MPLNLGGDTEKSHHSALTLHLGGPFLDSQLNMLPLVGMSGRVHPPWMATPEQSVDEYSAPDKTASNFVQTSSAFGG